MPLHSVDNNMQSASFDQGDTIVVYIEWRSLMQAYLGRNLLKQNPTVECQVDYGATPFLLNTAGVGVFSHGLQKGIKCIQVPHNNLVGSWTASTMSVNHCRLPRLRMKMFRLTIKGNISQRTAAVILHIFYPRALTHDKQDALDASFLGDALLISGCGLFQQWNQKTVCWLEFASMYSSPFVERFQNTAAHLSITSSSVEWFLIAQIISSIPFRVTMWIWL